MKKPKVTKTTLTFFEDTRHTVEGFFCMYVNHGAPRLQVRADTGLSLDEAKALRDWLTSKVGP